MQPQLYSNYTQFCEIEQVQKSRLKIFLKQKKRPSLQKTSFYLDNVY
jgi:hypothetical protein